MWGGRGGMHEGGCVRRVAPLAVRVPPSAPNRSRPQVIPTLLRYWPCQNSSKQIVLLNEIEDVCECVPASLVWFALVCFGSI